MAEACRRYLDEVVLPQGILAGRDRMAGYLGDLYARRLRLPGARERTEAATSRLEDHRSVLVEMAHDGQLPHLGIVRLVLKAREVASLAGSGMALYLVGDHYSADMRPENLFLGLPLRGADSDHAKNPLTIPIGRKLRHVPFFRLPPPSEGALDELDRRAEAWVVNNATYVDRKASLGTLVGRLRDQMERLHESARLTTSLGDWLMRVQVIWFDDLFGGIPDGLAILPMSGIMEWVPEILSGLLESDEEVARTKIRISEEQRGRGEIPYLAPESSPSQFWIYCPRCWRRYRAAFHETHFTADCGTCGKSVEATWPGEGRLMPDIVAFECALFRTGLSGWIVGSQASYHPVIEKAYQVLHGVEMPPKRFVTSIPRFRGIGEPPEGHTRARLLRVLLEVDAPAVRDALTVSWDLDPEIVSPHLGASAEAGTRAQK